MSTRKRKSRTHPETHAEVIAEVSPISRGGRSLFSARSITASNVTAFHSENSAVDEACRRLESFGLEIIRSGSITCTVKASLKHFQDVFGTELKVEEVDTFEGTEGIEAKVSSFSTGAKDGSKFLKPPEGLADVIEGAVLPTPHSLFQSPLPPAVGYHHLDVPADVSLLLNADKAHRLGVTGKCIRVAMVDTGHYAHPFFASRGYHVDPVVLSADSIGTDPLADDISHGTMESANIFAVAPDVTLLPVKTSLANTAAAFTTAMDQNPHIITNSWGRSLNTPPFNAVPVEELPLAAAIAEAVRRGIIVCFSAGNGHIGWPAMHPDVIAVGGVFAHPDASFEASSYASSFTTPIFPNRNVPDVCGLVGQLPRGVYIMLPGQPGSSIDASLAGGAFPNNDETASDDGWACISGTSASSPQIAGICSLLLQCAPGLATPQAKKILQTTALDVTQGSTNPVANQPPGAHNAGPGRDLATGFGLADASAAVLEVMARSGQHGGCGCKTGKGCNKGYGCGCKDDDRIPPETRYQYAVKFVCGKSCGDVVAPGTYHTAINIHNPTERKVRFRRKVAIALPGEKPGHVSDYGVTTIGPDEALEIDCPDIYKIAGIPCGCFLKGFVVIESGFELDIVAVYTATKKGKQVETLHMEHYDPRRLARSTPPPPDKRPRPDKLPDLVPVRPFPPGPPFFPSNFCKSPGELAIIVRNQGDGPAGPTTTRVDFFEIGVQVDEPTPALAAGAETELTVQVPSGCYNPESCNFRIMVNSRPDDGVEEIDNTNNTAASNCVVLQ